MYLNEKIKIFFNLLNKKYTSKIFYKKKKKKNIYYIYEKNTKIQMPIAQQKCFCYMCEWKMLK